MGIQMASSKPIKEPRRSSLPILHCECGHEILLLPDRQILGKAIEEHVLDDKNKYGLSEQEAERLKDSLIAQAFKLISK
jgi:hypothetical protein